MSLLAISRRLAVGMLVAAALSACAGDDVSAPEPAPTLETQVWAASLGINLAAMTKLPSGVYIQDLTTGTGTAVTATSTVTVLYTLWLANGSQVQSNDPARGGVGGPFTERLSGLIDGWKFGMLGMKVGGKRRLVIPAALGYGPTSQPGIPANSNLVFDVTLQGVS